MKRRPTFSRRSPPLVHNPPWTTAAVVSAWELIQDSVKPAWLPLLDDVSIAVAGGDRVSGEVHEYGCGVYGCVFPTHDPAVVLKVTTDATEADFAHKVAKLLPTPIVVFYYSVVALNQFHNKRRIYLLWRESANKVGEIGKVVGRRAVELIDQQHAAAQLAWKSLREMPVPEIDGTPHQKQMIALELWRRSCEKIARQNEVPQIKRLGQGMLDAFIKENVFFGDVHSGNVGLVHREDGGHWVITDPGYVSALDDE